MEGIKKVLENIEERENINELFNILKSKKDQFKDIERIENRKKIQKEYYQRNKEKRKEYQHNYGLNHIEEIKEKQKEIRDKRKEELAPIREAKKLEKERLKAEKEAEKQKNKRPVGRPKKILTEEEIKQKENKQVKRRGPGRPRKY